MSVPNTAGDQCGLEIGSQSPNPALAGQGDKKGTDEMGAGRATEASGERMLSLELEVVQGYLIPDRWQVVDQSEGCRALNVSVTELTGFRYLLSVKASEAPEGSLILVKKTEHVGGYRDEDRHESYHLFQVVPGQLVNLSGKEGKCVIGHWLFDSKQGTIAFASDYTIHPGEWGYFEALHRCWLPEQHFVVAGRTAGCENYAAAMYTKWGAAPNIFRQLLNPLIQAQKGKEQAEQKLAKIETIFAEVFEEDDRRPVVALSKSSDSLVRGHALTLVGQLEQVEGCGIKLPEKRIRSVKPKSGSKR